jgi:hypothetical protein
MSRRTLDPVKPLGLSLVLAVSLGGLAGCRQRQDPVPLRSLERNGAVSFFCADGNGKGLPISACPDFDREDETRVTPENELAANRSQRRAMFALVTQTLRGEVAVVQLSSRFGDDQVLDTDPSVPGVTPLPLGANPGAIVSTPGGQASFVTSAEAPNRHAVFALPTSCILPQRLNTDGRKDPPYRRPASDVSQWPACSLPTAPGAMVLFFDRSTQPGAEGGAGGAGGGGARLPTPEEINRCWADLSVENQSAAGTLPPAPGRHKLAVALPAEGKIWILDAQRVLDKAPGSFAPCEPEQEIALRVALPAEPVAQTLPAELGAAPGFEPARSAPPSSDLRASPVAMAVGEDVLYVSDRTAPVIHRIDVSRASAAAELEPLLPLSYEEPERRVTTAALAVTPRTRSGQRFLYAVDELDGGVMVFDVSPGATNRTPLVLPRADYLPGAPPDRIRFPAPAKALEFAYRDLPEVDPVTGVATVGVSCDPNPSTPSSAPAAQHRPDSAMQDGAGPLRLRGLFGLVALSSGQLGIIDVDDFDEPCRRPALANASDTPDFQGCAGDPAGIPYFTDDRRESGQPTVSDEATCNVVEPHRMRSAKPLATRDNIGVHAPSLRTYPSLRNKDGRGLSSSQSEQAAANPRLLAVPLADGVAARAYVAGSLKRSDAEGEALLDTDPRTAEHNTATLNLVEPRAFAPEEAFAVTYEGVVAAERPGGLLDLGSTVAVLADGDGRFCERGVEGADLIVDRGERLEVSSSNLATFTRWHADYVEITAELPEKDDRYWRDSNAANPGYTCGGRWAAGRGHSECEGDFGTPRDPTANREWRITGTYSDRLELEPRGEVRDREDFYARVNCCFGAGRPLAYRVRAGNQWIIRGEFSGFQSALRAGEGERCERDPDPRLRRMNGRAFEIGTRESCGTAARNCVACVVDSLRPAAPDSPCVFENNLMRFALYRGTAPTPIDHTFTVETTGGFLPLLADLVPSSGSVSPQAVVFVPQLQDAFIADGGSQGLVGVSLDTVKPYRFIF